MSTRIQRLVNKIQREVNVWTTTNGLKARVGDSVDNNRVPTVRQTIRYLNTQTFTETLAQDLELVYTVLRQNNLFRKLRRRNNRTDAYDINELLTLVNTKVVKDPGLKSTLGRVIKSVI